ncbi:hypothetical protein A9404_05285 [Halothiobacillus diazotrophicus]|uniref:Carboxypeptidase regulatory-like domain-containing protein n=1 Tax=Halothiobacillus diazotrophicus TaxID=1860122 RepID=A0A191ZG56_9GAMM|nr:hypothetical protein [Halothiobacillus diazotrophicus]ANJ66866.1 hypothetical protein A9404_05285 [Halothiobacillus diazotrophicus]
MMIASSLIKSRSLVLFAGAVLVSSAMPAGVALAGTPEEPSIHSLTPAEVQSGALTIEQGHEGVRYVSGGVGVEERAWLAAHESQFNTRLTFAVEPGGAFVSDVQVLITAGQGKTVLKTTTNGPKLLAELPAGSYEIQATHDGQTLHRTFTVASHGHVALGFGFKN